MSKNKKLISILGIIFILMLILNFITPIIADDFGYALNLDGKHLRGLKDIINFQIVHYKWWGGRIIAHTLAQLFLMLPKYIFNICNSLCFTLLIYLIYKISNQKKENISLLLVIFFLIYFVTPVFGQNTLWLIGSCNYLWTTTIVLLLHSIYLKSKRDDSISFTILIFILGLIAGWTNENTGIASIIVLSLIVFSNKNIKKWKIIGLIGHILGFIILIISPGNYVRSDAYSDNSSFIMTIINRFIDYSKYLIINLWPLLTIIIILLIIYLLTNKRVNKYFYYYLIGGIIAIYSMLLSPTFPDRAWFIVVVFLTISFIILLSELNCKNIIITILVIVSLIFISDYLVLFDDISKLNSEWKMRINYINKHNKDNYRFEIYESRNKKNPSYGLTDLADSKEKWPSNDIERYFNKNSIIGYWE